MSVIDWIETKFGDLLRIVGLLLAAQGVVTQYFTGIGVPEHIITAVFGGLGLLVMVAGKQIDSTSYTKIQTVGVIAATQITPDPGPLH